MFKDVQPTPHSVNIAWYGFCMHFCGVGNPKRAPAIAKLSPEIVALSFPLGKLTLSTTTESTYALPILESFLGVNSGVYERYHGMNLPSDVSGSGVSNL